MPGRRLWIVVTTLTAGVLLPATGLAAPAGAAPPGGLCSAGALSLALPGSHLYPDTGNGGYTSVHTLVHLVYDANANRFLPGNSVILTIRRRSACPASALTSSAHRRTKARGRT